ncbi:MAG: 6-phosphofructokinase [Bacteroidetes bacterium]|nr:6-phosphofructokinase [Bacteroidota bacterium]
MNVKKIRHIGLLTSGGDSPGMNAAIRAVVRTAIFENLEISGIIRGYDGLINKDFISLGPQSVSNIIHRGGTILKTARSEAFRKPEGRQKAYAALLEQGIDALVVIGGNGTFRGAIDFINDYDFPIVGLPGTIDNDLFGTDRTIGFDTALNTILDAVDKIRDTATSCDRLFFIEVMGRDTGFIALQSGLAAGAEFILVPETPTYIENISRLLDHDWRQSKSSGIIIVAEGDEEGGAEEIAGKLRKVAPHYDTRVSILGHIQRGGAPSAVDRVLAGTLGYEAVYALLNGAQGVMLGMVREEVVMTPFHQAVSGKKNINRNLLEIARILAI